MCVYVISLKKKKKATYDSDTTVTLKQGQGHQFWYELVDPKQGINRAKIERPPLNSFFEKANVLRQLLSQFDTMQSNIS